MRRVLVGRLGWPEDSKAMALGSGIDPDTGDLVHFTVDAERAPTLMAGLVRGEIPELELRRFDEIDWTRWYDPS
jgi:hypothetical protein